MQITLDLSDSYIYIITKNGLLLVQQPVVCKFQGYSDPSEVGSTSETTQSGDHLEKHPTVAEPHADFNPQVHSNSNAIR